MTEWTDQKTEEKTDKTKVRFKAREIFPCFYFSQFKILQMKNILVIDDDIKLTDLLKDYLEKYVETIKMIGQVQDGYFIDIGIPEDLEKANKQFEN